MESIRSLLDTTISYLHTIGLADVVDILIVAYLIYRIILFVRRTNSYNIARTIMALIVVYLLSYLLGLTMINYLIRTATEIGLLSLVILFQPELRRVLERVGRSFSSNRTVSTPVLETAIAQTVLACTDMSVHARTVCAIAVSSTGVETVRLLLKLRPTRSRTRRSSG